MRTRIERRGDPRADRSNIVGGVVLGAAVLALLVAILIWAFVLGVAQAWPVLGWIAIGLLAAVLVSIEALFLRDYLRWRRRSSAARRRP